jgi:hypothetical protein
VIIAAYLIISFFKNISLKPIYKRAVKLFFSFGPARRELDKNLEKARLEILSEYPPSLLPKLDKIPYKTPEI